MARKYTRKTFDVTVRTFEPTIVVKPVPAAVSDDFLTAYHDASWNADATVRVTLDASHRVR
jgi:hypothetical protein